MIQIISSIICFLGIYSGVAVGKIAEEELKGGKKYFMILEDIIFGAIFFFVVHFYSRNIPISVISGMIMATIWWMANMKIVTKTIVAYLLLGATHVFGYYTLQNNPDIVTYPALLALIFIYGFPAGSLLVEKKKPIFKIGLYALPYLVISVIGLIVLG